MLPAEVSAGFVPLQPKSYDILVGQTIVNFRETVEDLQTIRKTLFGGFSRCLYPVQKFDSDSERRFAVLLEDDQTVLK